MLKNFMLGVIVTWSVLVCLTLVIYVALVNYSGGGSFLHVALATVWPCLLQLLTWRGCFLKSFIFLGQKMIFMMLGSFQ